jgi:SAM-dependent methyltransferase
VAPGVVVGVDVAASVVEEATAHARASGVDTVSFVAGDFRAPAQVGLEEGSFDLVHAHQVLQHLRDPVGALVSLGRLARPGGLVAVRDADYAAMTWAPASAGLERWLAVYRAVARRNGAEPDAGRWLLRWAWGAGLKDLRYTSSTWTFATAADRDWWAQLWAERTVMSSFAEQAADYGIASPSDLEDLAGAWHAWRSEPDAVFVVVHGELLGRP